MHSHWRDQHEQKAGGQKVWGIRVDYNIKHMEKNSGKQDWREKTGIAWEGLEGLQRWIPWNASEREGEDHAVI